MADYNQVRVSLGLPRVTSFNQITSDSKLAQTLQNLYHTVVDPITGKSLSPNQSADYAKAAIGKSVAEYSVNNNLSTLNFNINLSGGTILAPYIIQNGSKDDFEKSYAQAFFGITTANQDAMSHVNKLGSSNTFTFAFEDMTGSVTNGNDRILMML